MPAALRWVAVAWGLLGLLGLLARALISLTPYAIEGLSMELSAIHWVVAVGWVGFMAYAEGYRGFQTKFAPMVAARLKVLRDEPTWLRLVLAPAFCMGLFDATRRRLLVSWGVLIAVIGLIVVVRLLPQPWRGIVDLGVVVGLTWGTLALLGHAAHTLWTGRTAASAELPGAPDRPPGEPAAEASSAGS